MPELNGLISNFTNNQYLKLRWTVTKIPGGSLISSAKFVVKTNETDPDGSAIFTKNITVTNVGGTGQVENTGSSGTGTIRFDVPPNHTALLVPETKYYYWIDLTFDTGEVCILEKGRIWNVQGSTHT